MPIWSQVTESLTGDSIPALSSLYGTPAFIGIDNSGGVFAGTVKTLDRYSDLATQIGEGKLARAIRDFFACAGQSARCLALPVDASESTVPGTLTVSTSPIGAPTINTDNSDASAANDYYGGLLLKVTAVTPALAFQYSIDGGSTWIDVGEVEESPASAYMEELGQLYIEFDAGTFSVGQTYTLDITPLKLDATLIAAAIDTLIASYRGHFEFLVVLEECDSAIATSVASKITSEWSAHNPIFAILETLPVWNADDKNAAIAALIAEFESFSSRYVAVAGLEALMVNPDGVNRARSVAASMAGILAKGKVSDSVGVLRNEFGKLVNAVALTPSDITTADAVLMNNARFCVPKKYEGYAGFFINNATLMSAPGDPYDDVEKIRVAAKMLRLCRVAALNCLHLDAASGGKYAFGGRGGLSYLQSELERAVSPMLTAEELMYFKAHVLSTPEEVYADKKVRVRLDFTCNPKMKIIELVADLVSPDEFARRNG